MPLYIRPLHDKPLPVLLADVIAEAERKGETVRSWSPFGPDLLVLTSPAPPGDVKPPARRQTRRQGPGEQL